MVSERYRCAIYSDFEDEEDEADFVYESEEEEFSDPKKEDDSVSALMEISINDIMFGSFGQESNLDIVRAIPIKTLIEPKFEGFTVKIGQINCSLNDASSFMNPEYKDEEKSQRIGFDLKSETDFQFSKNVHPASTDSVCISHIFHASDLFRHSRSEFGNLLSSTGVSSPAMIVFTKASELRSFTFDPGGVSKDTVYAVKSHVKSFSDLNFGNPIHLIAPLPYAVARHHNFIFDRGKPPPTPDRIRSSSSPSRTGLISIKPAENLILIFDPGGKFIIFSVRVVCAVSISFGCCEWGFSACVVSLRVASSSCVLCCVVASSCVVSDGNVLRCSTYRRFQVLSDYAG